MNRYWLYAIIFMVGVLVSAVSQVLLKKESMEHHDSLIKEYLNVRVILAYAMFFATTLISIIAYRWIPLSLGTVLESTSYIYVTAFGVIIFKEKINSRKMLALVLILLGVIFFAFGD